MMQDDVFRSGEGDAWFRRNRAALSDESRFDWPIRLIEMLDCASGVRRVLELGCANGWRLARLAERLPEAEMVGIDASAAAIEDGQRRYGTLNLMQGGLADVPLTGPFDLVIVNFVLHWVDRRTLFRSFAEIDRLVADGGVLVLGDFFPAGPQRRRYHHLPDREIYTYKQDYGAVFQASGIYREIGRAVYEHDRPGPGLYTGQQDAAVCVALKKSFNAYYVEC